ncbi:hypothetical protein THIX_20521 [Thiomonas sp. X19]|nr:hypothetical protein THIX_20521 [Thiomonas sp. X19]
MTAPLVRRMRNLPELASPPRVPKAGVPEQGRQGRWPAAQTLPGKGRALHRNSRPPWPACRP